jgi:hypothetical protein
MFLANDLVKGLAAPFAVKCLGHNSVRTCELRSGLTQRSLASRPKGTRSAAERGVNPSG